MDVNGMPIEGFPSTNLPLGLGAAPPLPAAMQAPVGGALAGMVIPSTEDLSEAEIEKIVMEYKASDTEESMEEYLDKMVPPGQLGRVLDGLDNNFT